MVVARITAMQEAARRDVSKTTEGTKPNSISNVKTMEKSLKGPEVIKNSLNESPRKRSEDVAVAVKRRSLKNKALCEACGGSAQKARDADDKVCLQECQQCRKKDHATPPNDTHLKYGHAKTHSIVINLDDSNRFTEEVTV